MNPKEGSESSGSVTIRDVAKLSGFSMQTVSRVINNSGLVKEETRKSVLDAIEKLNYHPNFWARNLQRQRANSIALSIPFSTEQIRYNPFFMEVISAVSNETTQSGAALNLFSYNEGDRGTELLISMYRRKVMSGLIHTCPHSGPEALIKLSHSGMPVVVIGRPSIDIGISYVDTDNVQLAYDCAKHLIEMGHRNITLINGPSYMTYSEDLYSGYLNAVIEAGIPANRAVSIETNFLEEDAERKAPGLFTTDNPSTAYITANTEIAFGLIKYIKSIGLSVPQDYSIITCSDGMSNEVIQPPLTSMQIDSVGLGRTAARIVLDGTAGMGHKIIMKAKMIIRESCRSLP